MAKRKRQQDKSTKFDAEARFRMCESKSKLTVFEANQYIRRSKTPLAWYECPICNCIHLTSKVR